MGKAARDFFLAFFALLGTSKAHDGSANGGSEKCAINPRAIVSDACASFSTLDSLNAEIQPTIRSLTHDSDFFSYYRLNLYDKVCPFWTDEEAMCGNIACAVNTIENEEDIPEMWRVQELSKLEGPKAHHPNKRLQKEAKPLLGDLGADVGESCVVEYDDECDDRDYCVPEDESASAKGDYLSLIDNPERFTGYAGPHANQIWEAIYRENCFTKASATLPAMNLGSLAALGNSGLQNKAAQGLRSVMRSHERQQVLGSSASADQEDYSLSTDDECLEKRVFYRIISGMHASISTHLCYDYLNQSTGTWGPNVQCYEQRIHTHPERLSNLYFNYALVLRAIAKVRKSLETYTFCSGDPSQDRLTKHKVLDLADQIARGPIIYDESLMFQDPNVNGLKEDFRNRFRNVSRTMDCVGCDKCRLWGKLQIAGYGTALKILFEYDENDRTSEPPFRRTELVALVNTLDKLSHSLSAIRKFETMLGPNHAHVDAETMIIDDGYPESRNTIDNDSESSILTEFQVVYHAFTWVLRRWWNLPSTFFHVFLVELSRVYESFIGIPISPRTWEFRRPTHDEL